MLLYVIWMAELFEWRRLTKIAWTAQTMCCCDGPSLSSSRFYKNKTCIGKEPSFLSYPYESQPTDWTFKYKIIDFVYIWCKGGGGLCSGNLENILIKLFLFFRRFLLKPFPDLEWSLHSWLKHSHQILWEWHQLAKFRNSKFLKESEGGFCSTTPNLLGNSRNIQSFGKFINLKNIPPSDVGIWKLLALQTLTVMLLDKNRKVFCYLLYRRGLRLFISKINV